PPKSSESLTYTLEIKKTPTKPQPLKLPPTSIRYSDMSGLNIYKVYSNSFIVGLGCPVSSILSEVWASTLYVDPLKQEVATVYLLNLGEVAASNVEVSFKNEVGEAVKKVLEIPPLSEVYLNFDLTFSGLNLTYNLDSLTTIRYEVKVGMDKYNLNVEPSTYTVRFSKVRFTDFAFLRSFKSQYTLIGGLLDVNENLVVKDVFKPFSALLLNVLPENVSYVRGDFLVKNETPSVVFKFLEISRDENLLFNYLLTTNSTGSYVLPPPLLILHSSKPFVDCKVYLGSSFMFKCLNVRFIKTSNLKVFSGEPLTVTLKIQNGEPKPLLNVKVSDGKPEQFKLVSGSLEFTISSIDAGRELSKSYQLSADSLGSYTLPPASLTFTYDGVELNSTSNQLSGLTVIPKLVITKSVDKTELNIGDTLNIQITVQNPTNLTFYGVSIFDPTIAGFTIKSGSNMLKGLTIHPGESKVLVYQVEAKMEGDFALLPAYVIYNYGGTEVRVDSQ
ncbi:MAG: BatD family protein, partial [Candidatus Bathyarchaeota archaeon]|nr:BatD family protein [Candidatus Bathyarchaeota archaeon]